VKDALNMTVLNIKWFEDLGKTSFFPWSYFENSEDIFDHYTVLQIVICKTYDLEIFQNYYHRDESFETHRVYSHTMPNLLYKIQFRSYYPATGCALKNFDSTFTVISLLLL
jgi:hypothetical protein